MSVTITDKHRRAFAHVGDVMVPGGDGLPSFSESGCLDQLEDVLLPSHSRDQKDLLMLMGLLGALPGPLLRGLLALTGWLGKVPGSVGAPFRMIDMGVRGVIYTLYYSGLGKAGARNTVNDGIDYHVQCRPD